MVTGSGIPNIRRILNDELIDEFEAIITSEKVTRGKPHPEPYLLGAQELGVTPAECLVVENAPLGIEAGKAAGMTVVALETTLERALTPGADHYVADIAALHGRWHELFG